MMKLILKKYGDPILRKKCQEVKEINEEILLNGILFIHRISFFQRWKIRKELRALTNEELKRESHPFS